MTWLLLAVAVLTLGVIGFLARPLAVTRPEVAGPQRHELMLVRDRLLAQLNELDAELADKGVDAQVAQDEGQRLAVELAAVLKQLDEVSTGNGTENQAGTGKRPWLIALLMFALVIPAVSAGLYLLENGATFKTLTRIEQGDTSAGKFPPMVMEMVARLEKRLTEEPNDAAGWARLGVSYANLGRMAEARQAYAKSYRLEPDNLEVITDYAWLVYGEDPKNTEGLAFELYTKLYRAQPQNPDALWFLGLAAYQHGEFTKSVKYWDRLLALLPPESPTGEHVRNAIAKAKQQGAGK
jgi:cytochrome c-type biogenesis protein CcmH